MPGLNPILTCREVVDLLGEDLDRSLPMSLEVRLKLHLFLCRSCRRFRRTFRTTVGVVHALRVAEDRYDLEALPDELVRRVMLRRQMAGVSGEEQPPARE